MLVNQNIIFKFYKNINKFKFEIFLQRNETFWLNTIKMHFFASIKIKCFISN